MIDTTKTGNQWWNTPGAPAAQQNPNLGPLSTGPTPLQNSPTPMAAAGNSGGGGDYTSAPSWAGSGWYRNWYQGSPDYTNEPMNQYAANQGWWRGPDAAGGLLWNNLYGWQDANAVRDKYMQAGAPVSNSAFASGNWFTPQTNQNWAEYYPNMKTDAQWQSEGYGWNPSTNQWEQGYSGGGGGGGGWNDDMTLSGGGGYFPDRPPDGGDGGGGGGGDNVDYTAFNNFPPEWDTASNVLQNMAYTGAPVNTPSAWFGAQNTFQNMANGMSADATPAYEAAKKAAQYDVDNAIKQAAEKAGLGGSRWSTPLGYTAQNIAGQSAANLGAQFAQQQLGAQENMFNRMGQGAQGLYGVGQGVAGLDTDTRNRMLQAAGQLPGLGQNYAQLPLQTALQSWNMGNQLYGQEQNAMDKYYQDFLRTASENNPYLQMIYSMATGQGAPQQYSQGMGSQLLGGLFGGLKTAGGLGCL